MTPPKEVPDVLPGDVPDGAVCEVSVDGRVYVFISRHGSLWYADEMAGHHVEFNEVTVFIKERQFYIL